MDGQGIIATLYEDGSANVTVTVDATGGNQSRMASIPPGQSSVTVDIRGIVASTVRNVTVRATGHGPLPPTCFLQRS
jgi:hypothetical protein